MDFVAVGLISFMTVEYLDSTIHAPYPEVFSLFLKLHV